MFKATATFSGFSVDDLSKAKVFYTENLGLQLADEHMGLRVQLPGSGQAFMYEKSDHQPASFTILNFVVDNIDETVDELKSQGISLERYDDMPAPQDEKGILRGIAANQGPDIAWFKDPAGNILSVLQEK
ncbi:MAG TPA: VOC family protein [Verrucomicrobiae bacterium]|nr:VOC family protein [Verrucomicrobiae bacterium]